MKFGLKVKTCGTKDEKRALAGLAAGILIEFKSVSDSRHMDDERAAVVEL